MGFLRGYNEILKMNVLKNVIANTNTICQNLMTLSGAGVLTATILLTVLSAETIFKQWKAETI